MMTQEQYARLSGAIYGLYILIFTTSLLNMVTQ
jgi:hypothetical protein